MICAKPFDSRFGCGQCKPCRINRSRLKATRIMLEARDTPFTGFLTLTYSDENVPKTSMGYDTLAPDDLRDFWKRLRYYLPPRSLRFLACGEYGDETFRPHYHAALLGFCCLGKELKPDSGLRCHCENCLLVEKAWGLGNITIDELNDTTAAYISGYVIKKMTNPLDIRLDGRYPEFGRQSLGIGKTIIPELAEIVTSEIRTMQYGDVPHSLKLGSKDIPLDRYMKRKLREHIGLEKIDPESGEITYGTPYETLSQIRKKSQSQEMQNVLETLRSNPSSSTYATLDQLRSNARLKMQQRVRNLTTKHDIYKKEKSL